MSGESFLPSKEIGESALSEPSRGVKEVWSPNPSTVECVRWVSSTSIRHWGKRKLSQSSKHSTVLLDSQTIVSCGSFPSVSALVEISKQNKSPRVEEKETKQIRLHSWEVC